MASSDQVGVDQGSDFNYIIIMTTEIRKMKTIWSWVSHILRHHLSVKSHWNKSRITNVKKKVVFDIDFSVTWLRLMSKKYQGLPSLACNVWLH